MLRRIGLSNFKCWKALDIELAPITLLFGVNSSGKSAILQSLLMLKQTADSLDRSQAINFGGGPRDYVDLGSYQDLVYGHDTTAKINIRLQWDSAQTIHYVYDGEGNRDIRDNSIKTIKYDVEWGIDDSIFIKRLRYDAELGDSTSVWVESLRDDNAQHQLAASFSMVNLESETVPPPDNSHGLPWTARYVVKTERGTLSLDFPWQFERFVATFQYAGPLRFRPQRYYPWTGSKPGIIEPDGENAIQALIASARGDGQLLSEQKNLLKSLKLVDDFKVKPISNNERLFEVSVTIEDVESSLSDVGFGVSQVLPVLTMLLSAPERSIILLEQPELHLHPNAQAALADLMLDVAEKRNLQLIVESHSEHIVRRLQRRIAEASPAFAKPENIKMYYCQPGEGGATIDEVVVDRFGQIVDWPEKFMGDISGDLHTMLKAALERRSQELERVGSGS